MKSKIREWYMSSYPNDSLAEEINKDVTFEDLYNALKTHKDVYECLGVVDSFIRENCFSKLAKLLNQNYDYIFYMWLSRDELKVVELSDYISSRKFMCLEKYDISEE